MNLKFTKKKVLIFLILVMLVAIAITGIVVFLKDNGQSIATNKSNAIDLNTLPVTTIQTATNDNVIKNEESIIIQEESEKWAGETESIARDTTIQIKSIRTVSIIEPEETIGYITRRERIENVNWSEIILDIGIAGNRRINYTKVNYRIEYYKNNETKPFIIEKYKDKYLAKVTISEEQIANNKPEDYEVNETKNENFSITLSADDSNNVIKVYYESQKLEISKTGPLIASAGDEITYILTVKNTGNVNAKTTVVDALPDGVTFIEASNSGVVSNKEITWNDIQIMANSNIELKVIAKIDDNMIGKTITNNVKMSNGATDTATTKIREVSSTIQETIQGETAKDDVNVILVIDISTSMRKIDSGNSETRVELAKKAAKSFVETLYANADNKDATISLVLFNKLANIQSVNNKQVATYSDKTEIITAIENIAISTAGTNMYDGLDKAHNLITGALKTDEKYKNNQNVVVFLGDGEPYENRYPNNSSGIIEKSKSIKNSGVIMYTIGFGADATQISNEIGSAYYILKNMADEGKFSTAITGAEIATVFTNIAEQVKTDTVTSNLSIISVLASNTLVIDSNNPITVKYKGITLFSCEDISKLANYDLTYNTTTKVLTWNINKWNSSEINTKVISDDIELSYFVEK